MKRVVLIAVAAAALCGCATKTPSLMSRFVRQGTPTTDLGGPQPRVAKSTTGGAERRSIVAVSRYYPSAADFEGADPQLRTALAAVQVAPTLAHHLEAAGAYYARGILDRAYDHLQSGLLIDPSNAAAHDAIARVWRDWGLAHLGLSSAYRAVHAAPRSATARHTLGTLFYKLGLRREAEHAFREVVDLDPHAWYAWKNLCTVVMADGRTKEAIMHCQRAESEQELAGKHNH